MREKLKNIFSNKFIYTISAIVGSAIVGYLLLVAVYLLPVDTIKANIQVSSSIQQTESDRYDWAPNILSSALDGFTDSLMLNMAAYKSDRGAFADAADNICVWDDAMEGSTVDILFNHVLSETDGAYDFHYGRYWHGHLLYLKPLLQFLSVADIRFLLMVVEFSLTVWLLILMHSKLGACKTAMFGFAFLLLNPISAALCMQYADIYLITVIAGLWILLKADSIDSDYWKVFIWIGIFTAFFDLLTYPLVGLGFSLVLCVLLSQRETINKLKMVIISSVLWVLGYAGMWMEKWIIQAIFSENSFMSALQQIMIRTSGDTSMSRYTDDDSIFNAIIANVSLMMSRPVKIIVLLAIVVLLLSLVTKKVALRKPVNALPLALIACYPLGWCMVVREHSALHAFFTHRIIAIAILAVGMIVVEAVKRKSTLPQSN